VVAGAAAGGEGRGSSIRELLCITVGTGIAERAGQQVESSYQCMHARRGGHPRTQICVDATVNIEVDVARCHSAQRRGHCLIGAAEPRQVLLHLCVVVCVWGETAGSRGQGFKMGQETAKG